MCFFLLLRQPTNRPLAENVQRGLSEDNRKISNSLFSIIRSPFERIAMTRCCCSLSRLAFSPPLMIVGRRRCRCCHNVNIHVQYVPRTSINRSLFPISFALGPTKKKSPLPLTRTPRRHSLSLSYTSYSIHASSSGPSILFRRQARRPCRRYAQNGALDSNFNSSDYRQKKIKICPSRTLIKCFTNLLET